MTDERIKTLESGRRYMDQRFEDFQQEYRRDAGRQRKRLCNVELDIRGLREEFHQERGERVEDRKKINDIYTAMKVLIWLGKAGIAVGGFFTAVYMAIKGDAEFLKSWWNQ